MEWFKGNKDEVSKGSAALSTDAGGFDRRDHGDDVVSNCDIRLLVKGHLPEAAHWVSLNACYSLIIWYLPFLDFHRQKWKLSSACAERLQPDAKHWPAASVDSWGAWDAENNPLLVYVLPLLTWLDPYIDLLSTQWASSWSRLCMDNLYVCVLLVWKYVPTNMPSVQSLQGVLQKHSILGV